MTTEQEAIISIIKDYLEANPSIRFMQALHNLSINQFADTEKPENCDYHLRDSYNDTDKEVLTRMVC